jgi:hypothetical protein
MAPKDKDKKCFVIGPIGDPNTETRNKADWLLKGIIKPVLTDPKFNYVVTRADQITEPGLITDQVITSTLDADLVVADLTGQNPNAFYELAIRHMAGKKTIHMVEEGHGLPFDIQDYRAIIYKTINPDDLEKAKVELRKQVEEVEKRGYKISNPVTKARGYQKLSSSSDPKDVAIAELRGSNEQLMRRVSKLEGITENITANSALESDRVAVKLGLQDLNLGELVSKQNAGLKIFPQFIPILKREDAEAPTSPAVDSPADKGKPSDGDSS